MNSLNRDGKEALYKIGDIVVVRSEKDSQKLCQGRVFMAEVYSHNGRFGTWFYGVEIPAVVGEPERVYSYEEDTGDAKTIIIKLTPYELTK